MQRSKPPKKSESLEVRLSYTTKTAFMARCRDEGRTASDAIRDFIDREIGASRSNRARIAWRPLLIAATAGLALGAVAAPSLAESMAADAAAFHRLDRDQDGRLSLREFRAR
ncbi:hypothetical protein [Brevundimonas sp. PAMC22021]|uniref:hypothetical protein n=1 Tax=Brevundimonas sp. PAMC22021 TaxID=2861285 RepID=UPI001C6384BB|nr:hypothetical protein [Brevundimonas sp. PAMC22021]QYF85720.1 hypothetical protein KY493_07490 [Brevundimonas sp. PAMC22021]